MSFERHRAQTICEALVGSSSLSDWSARRSTFEQYSLTAIDANNLRQALFEDCSHLIYKGILSLIEAMSAIRNNLFSWSVIRLYYSCFYFLRASLASRGFAVVKNKSLYLLEAGTNEKPKKCTGQKYRNDHVGVINIYRDFFNASDKLQSNQIDMENPYEWLMNVRNQVNYRERKFHDPNCPAFCQIAADRIRKGELDHLLDAYIDDKDFIYCFQAEHAWLALPLKRAIITIDDATNAAVPITLSPDKMDLIDRLIGANGQSSHWRVVLLSRLRR